jgi:hypothetical protein
MTLNFHKKPQRDFVFHFSISNIPYNLIFTTKFNDSKARSSLYANTQLHAHRRAEKKNKEQNI